MREKIIAKLEADLKTPDTTVDLTKLTDEEREKAFIEFGEGSEELTNFLRAAYNHGAPSMFACSGHGYRQPYVILKVTDENLQMLQYLGKVLSNYGVATSFTDHYEFGKRVDYRGFIKNSPSPRNLCGWLEIATDVLENPNKYIEEANNPQIYYHEFMNSSYIPLGYRMKKKLLEELKKQEQKKQSKVTIEEEQTRIRK